MIYFETQQYKFNLLYIVAGLMRLATFYFTIEPMTYAYLFLGFAFLIISKSNKSEQEIAQKST
jgi:hypothetical protein